MEHYRGMAIPTTVEQVCDPQRMALLVYDMQVGVLGQIDDSAGVITRVATVLDAARSGYVSAQADVRSSSADLVYKEQQFARMKELRGRGLIAQQSLDDAANNLAAAHAKKDANGAAVDLRFCRGIAPRIGFSPRTRPRKSTQTLRRFAPGLLYPRSARRYVAAWRRFTPARRDAH